MQWHRKRVEGRRRQDSSSSSSSRGRSIRRVWRNCDALTRSSERRRGKVVQGRGSCSCDDRVGCTASSSSSASCSSRVTGRSRGGSTRRNLLVAARRMRLRLRAWIFPLIRPTSDGSSPACPYSSAASLTRSRGAANTQTRRSGGRRTVAMRMQTTVLSIVRDHFVFICCGGGNGSIACSECSCRGCHRGSRSLDMAGCSCCSRCVCWNGW